MYKSLDCCFLPCSNELQPWVTSLRVTFNSVLRHFTYENSHFLIDCSKGFNGACDYVYDLPLQENSYTQIQEMSWGLCDNKTLEKVSSVLRVSAFLNRCSHANVAKSQSCSFCSCFLGFQSPTAHLRLCLYHTQDIYQQQKGLSWSQSK